MGDLIYDDTGEWNSDRAYVVDMEGDAFEIHYYILEKTVEDKVKALLNK